MLPATVIKRLAALGEISKKGKRLKMATSHDGSEQKNARTLYEMP
jgi:hypothetical protein